MSTTTSTTTYSDDTIVRRNIKRELPCKLSEEEFTRIARQRATKEAERDELQADLVKEKKRRTDQIEELDDEIGKMGRELRTGEQERTVPCDEVFRKLDDGTGWIFVIRKDTYAEVERRPANAHETQRYLPGVDGPGATPSVLDAARARQRSALEDTSDVPADDTGSDVPSDDGDGAAAGDEDAGAESPSEQATADDKPAGAKPKREKFDAALLAEGKCALRFEGGAACTREMDHDGLHDSGAHKWKAKRPKIQQTAPAEQPANEGA